MILCIGDLHLSRNRLQLCDQVLSWVADVVEDKRPDKLIYLGDIFDHHNTLHVEAQGLFSRHLKRTTSLSEVVIIRGNHDNFRPTDNRYHSLQGFELSDRAVVVDAPCVIDGLGFVPFLVDHSAYTADQAIVFTHNAFIGADFGFVTAETGIAREQIRSDLVVSGHIHKRQVLFDGSLIYVGTPYAWSARDIDQSKGIMLLDERDLSTEWIQSPLPVWRSIKVDVAAGFDEVLGDDVYVITLIGTKAEVKAMMASKEFQAKIKGKKVQIRTDFIDRLKTVEREIKTSSMRTTVSRYVQEVYRGSLDKTDLASLILKYLEET